MHSTQKIVSLFFQINQKMFVSRLLGRKPGHRIGKQLRINHKKNERHRAKPGLARLEKSLPTSNLIEQPRDIDNPYCHKHLHFYPRFLQKRLLKDSEAAQKKAGGMPIYKGSWDQNRYNVRPGYRWDGVDRGNGFEKRYFRSLNAKKALKEYEIQYLTEDM